MTISFEVRYRGLQELMQIDRHRLVADLASDMAHDADQSGDSEMHYRALHVRAVALHKIQELSASKQLFENLSSSEQLGEDYPVLNAQVLRDYGILMLDIGMSEDAYEMCLASWWTLRNLGKTHEAAIGFGFIGRTLANRKMLEETDEDLRRGDSRGDELDNLLWLMRLTPSIRDRRSYLRRAHYLANKLNSKQRYREASIIALNPTFYRLTKALQQ